MDRYNPLAIEAKWQAIWEKDKPYHANEHSDKPKKYLAEMFPYPSGAGLHVGHVRNFTIVDVLARFYAQNGYNVLRPFGYDTFGLPAENYAIKTGTAPQEITKQNIDNFRTQAKRLGYAIDWDREINTSSPEYYKWTEWCFKKLFEKGLAYQKESYQWWCPVDQTVLANEQVENGHCWRCGHEVEKKKMKQWFFKITAYADELLADIDSLDWPDKIKTMQKNWIGRSEGALISFRISGDLASQASQAADEPTSGTNPASCDSSDRTRSASQAADGLASGTDSALCESNDRVRVASQAADGPTSGTDSALCRPDRFGRSEMYIPDGTDKAASQSLPAAQCMTSKTAKSPNKVEAVPLTVRIFTTRPDTLNGATFMVLAPEHPLVKELTTAEQSAAVEAYQTSAMKKSEIERQENKEKTGVFTGSYAINPLNGNKIPIWVADYVLIGYGEGAIMAVPSDDDRDREFAEKFGLEINEKYKPTTLAELEQKGIAQPKVTYKMRDWLISRQRYWGCPIPIAYDKNGVAHAIPDEDLPVILPDITDYQPDNSGRSALAKATDWLKVTIDGEEMTRETDTLDGYACSSWYLWRYVSPHDATQAWGPEAIKYWAPTDIYVGGDHAVAHLLYIRFWCKFFADEGYLPFREPIKRLLYNGYINAPDGKKMSKSKGNVVDPLDVINDGYGADTLRTYEMFIGPYDQDAAWDPRSVGGVYRFLNRCWTLVFKNARVAQGKTLQLRHRTIKKVTDDLTRYSFNTAVAALMEYVNELYKLGADPDDLIALAKLLKPFAPHLASEMLEYLHSDDEWPTYDEQYLTTDSIEIIVQVNGKLRARLSLPADASEEEIITAALASDNVQKFVSGTPKKTIYIAKSHLLNIVA